jgi:uncharacterized membrane protein
MNKRIDQYLNQLKTQMTDCDKATIQDALADAQEHLITALANRVEDAPNQAEEELLEGIIAEYGTPEEIAAAYKQAEIYLTPYVAASGKSNGRGFFSRFFGIYSDPTAWGSVLYMVVALITGILYFSWVTVGAATTLSFSLFLFGIPLAVLFLLSVQGLGLLEGRLVEGLLGVRMPRRPIYFPKDKKWFDRLKLYLSDRQTWLGLLYMLLQLPVGVLYFTVAVTVISLGVAFMAAPFIQEMLNMPVVSLGSGVYYIPGWAMPFTILLGVFLLTGFMHLAKGIGKIHGGYAKRLLVAD